MEPKIQEPGIYFGMPATDYHSAFALSASGIKSLRVSSLDWWSRSPLNPAYEPEDKEAFVVGHAYHKRIAEGREAFYAAYGPTIDPADYPTALRTNEDLRLALEAAGIKAKASVRKAELIAALQSADPSAVIWETVAQAHAEKYAGKILLSPSLIASIETAAAMIEKHPALCKAFTGGMPEVSIFWTDPESQIPMKMRADYIKPRAVVDLKTFDNSAGLPLDRAITRSIANNSYHIQAALYLDGVEVARHLIRQGKVFGDVDKDFLAKLLAADDRTFLFVFQQKGIAPLACGRVLPQMILDIGRMEVEAAKAKFQQCWDAFGVTPWVHVDEIKTFDSTEFPSYLAA